ncbi:MAG: hypothetical protein HQL15_00060 [Candidatus Omnitrophica bacterium]|nr:hypothetical protein [Candidatus Omnitrophota bacterium]
MKNEIDFGLKSDEDRLQRWVKLSPKKKLEWLYQMHMFIRKAYTPKQKEIFWKLRESGQVSGA